MAKAGKKDTDRDLVAKKEVYNDYPNETRSIILQRLKDEMMSIDKAKK